MVILATVCRMLSITKCVVAKDKSHGFLSPSCPFLVLRLNLFRPTRKANTGTKSGKQCDVASTIPPVACGLKVIDLVLLVNK